MLSVVLWYNTISVSKEHSHHFSDNDHYLAHIHLIYIKFLLPLYYYVYELP